MTAAEADAAARKAGYITIRGEQLEGSAEVGRYLTEQNPLYVARGIYALVASQAADTLRRCDTALDRQPEPEMEFNLLGIKKNVLGELLASADGMVKSCSVDQAPPASPEPLRPAGFGPNANIQIVVGPQQPQLAPAAQSAPIADVEPESV